MVKSYVPSDNNMQENIKRIAQSGYRQYDFLNAIFLHVALESKAKVNMRTLKQHKKNGQA
jgi:hypothetical protein